MKKLPGLFLLLVVAALALILWFDRRESAESESSPGASSNSGPSDLPPTLPKVIEAPLKMTYLATMKAMMLSENQPIEFYAHIIDQNGNPVPRAQLELRISRVNVNKVRANFPNMKMGEEQETITNIVYSDASGRVNFTGQNGHYLLLWTISCEGYSSNLPLGFETLIYEPGGKRQAIKTLEGQDGFDPKKGYTLHLWKKSATELLIPIHFIVNLGNGGLRFFLKPFPNYGVEVSEADADFAIEATLLHPTDPNRQYDRRISILGLKGSGIVETADPYPYAAPETGYLPALYYDTLPSQGYASKEASDWKKNFYLKARSGRIYGGLTIKFDAGKIEFNITGYINANGSRILEPDPGKFITNRLEIQRIDEATRAN